MYRAVGVCENNGNSHTFCHAWRALADAAIALDYSIYILFAFGAFSLLIWLCVQRESCESQLLLCVPVGLAACLFALQCTCVRSRLVTFVKITRERRVKVLLLDIYLLEDQAI